MAATLARAVRRDPDSQAAQSEVKPARRCSPALARGSAPAPNHHGPRPHQGPPRFPQLCSEALRSPPLGWAAPAPASEAGKGPATRRVLAARAARPAAAGRVYRVTPAAVGRVTHPPPQCASSPLPYPVAATVCAWNRGGSPGTKPAWPLPPAEPREAALSLGPAAGVSLSRPVAGARTGWSPRTRGCTVD